MRSAPSALAARPERLDRFSSARELLDSGALARAIGDDAVVAGVTSI
jgi:hypothetical protein